jgi:transcriptional regulator with XRE-family HTH domain
MGHARNRPERLAEKLLQIRKALGLSQKQMAERLAERAGVKITYKNISKYERDKSVPFIEIILAYARLANVEMNQIADDDLDLDLVKNHIKPLCSQRSVAPVRRRSRKTGKRRK